MRNQPKPQEIYRHFKGNLYRIVTLAEHESTGGTLVIYQALYGDNKVFARSLSEFLSVTDREKYPDAGQQYRFELQQELIWPNVNQQEAGGKESEEKPTDKVEDTTKNKIEDQKEDSITDKEEKPADQQPDQADPAEQPLMDPQLLEFLDAKTYVERLNILSCMHHKITDDMINTMAIVLDIEVKEGELEERYTQLRSCLLTLEKYECNRLR